MAKVQLWDKLYKEIEGIIWEESYLPRISRPSSLNRLSFYHLYIVFDVQSPLKER